jgi:hypothetical protein
MHPNVHELRIKGDKEDSFLFKRMIKGLIFVDLCINCLLIFLSLLTQYSTSTLRTHLLIPMLDLTFGQVL